MRAGTTSASWDTSPRRGDWFDGMTLTRRDDGTTLIDGTFADQSELHGAVRKLSDIGVPLVPVTLTAGRGSRNLSQTHTHCEGARMTGDTHNSTAREQRRTDPMRRIGPRGRVNQGETWLGRLAHVVRRYRWLAIGVWIMLTVFGGFAAGQLSSRWFQSTSAPGRPAYETGQQALKGFGAGVRPPNVVVFHSASGDVTGVSAVCAVCAAMARVATASPGALTSSYFSTGSLAYVSGDRRTTFEEVYLPGRDGVDCKSGAVEMRAVAAAGLPAGVTVDVTGRAALDEATAQGAAAGRVCCWSR